MRIKAIGGTIPGQSSLGKPKANDPMNKSLSRSIRGPGGIGGLNSSINSKNGSLGIGKGLPQTSRGSIAGPVVSGMSKL
jgi:hypothetical protein